MFKINQCNKLKKKIIKLEEKYKIIKNTKKEMGETIDNHEELLHQFSKDKEKLSKLLEEYKTGYELKVSQVNTLIDDKFKLMKQIDKLQNKILKNGG